MFPTILDIKNANRTKRTKTKQNKKNVFQNSAKYRMTHFNPLNANLIKWSNTLAVKRHRDNSYLHLAAMFYNNMNN